MSNIPDHIKKYLWDINVENLSDERHYKFIIERILEYGDKEAVDWIEKNFQKEKIIETLKKSKRISSKTGNFYAMYYDIPKEELECIKKPYTQKQNRF